MGRKIGVIFSYILMGVEILSSLLFTPFLIRCLGQSEFGVYTLINSITSYLVLLDLGIGNSIVRYAAKFRINKQKDKQRKFVGVAILFYTVIAIITVLIGFVMQTLLPTVFGKGLTKEELQLASALLHVAMINMAATFLFTVFDKIILAYEKYVVAKSLAIAKIILRVLVMSLFLLRGHGALMVVIVNLGVTILIGIVSMIYVLNKIKLKPCFQNVEFGFMKEIIVYSAFIFIQMVATQINAMADHVLLGVYSSATILAVYGVGAQIIQYYQQISMSINGILMPGVVKMVEQKASPEQLQQEMIRIGRIIFMVLGEIFAVFLVFGRQFVVLWAGIENEQAYIVTALIMFPMLFYLTQSIGTQILWAKDKHRLQAIIKICIAMANIVLSVVLIKWNALLGATIGTMIAYFAGDVLVMNIVFTKDIGISMKEYYKGIFKGIVSCVILSFLGGITLSRLIGVTGWISLLVEIGLSVGIYGISMFFYGMNEYEKSLAKEMVQKMQYMKKRK